MCPAFKKSFLKVALMVLLVYRNIIISAEAQEAVSENPNKDSQACPKIILGVNDWVQIKRMGGLFVDKTDLVKTLIERGGKYYLITRPPRFGKTFLLNLISAVFKGKKSLFEGTAIAGSNYKWETHPVLEFDFSEFDVTTSELFAQSFSNQILRLAQMHEVTIREGMNIKDQLIDLIVAVKAKNKMASPVVLIDDYDSPFHNCNQSDLVLFNEGIIRYLSEFFGVLKSRDKDLRLVYITGVDRYPLANFFPNFNNVEDLSFDPIFAPLLGFTSDEVKKYFMPCIQELVKEHNKLGRKDMTEQKALEELERYYYSYNFVALPLPFKVSKVEKVYNPYSILKYFSKMRAVPLSEMWLDTSQSRHFIETVQKFNKFQFSADGYHVNTKDLVDSLNPSADNPAVQLYNHGYLTITGYNHSTNEQKLDFPNLEVRKSVTKHLYDLMVPEKIKVKALNISKELTGRLETKDFPKFIEDLNKVLKFVSPYIKPRDNSKIHLKYDRHSEGYYQTQVYLILFVLSNEFDVENEKVVYSSDENCTSDCSGQIDIFAQSATSEYIFVCKFEDGDASKGLEEGIGYMDRFIRSKKNRVIISLCFTKIHRGLGHWKIAAYDENRTLIKEDSGTAPEPSTTTKSPK